MREQRAQHTSYGTYGGAIPKRASATIDQQPLQRGRNVPTASPHRAGHSSGIHPEDQPSQSGELDEDEGYYPAHMGSSARHLGIAPYRAAPTSQAHQVSRRRPTWVLRVGMTMSVVVLGWILFSVVPTWWQHTLETWQYGYPRTYQTDAVVGHHDSAAHPSHFIALNLHGRIEVIELAGGDPARAQIYVGPTLFGADADQVPVTLTFADVNGDGKPDMELDVEGNLLVFLNDGKTFVANHS